MLTKCWQLVLCLLFLVFHRSNANESSVLISEDEFEVSDLGGIDLKIQTWAKFPMVHSPVAMDVDAYGRVWVVEDWHGRKIDDGKKGRGNILILEDTDLDGKADKAHDFGPRFSSIPLGITIFDNVIVVAMAPDLIVYTDVNRNAVYDEGTDKKEIILSGFEGHSHDHSLHGVVGGPDGKWYFSQGNTGLNIKTRDDQNFVASSYYSNNRQDIGKVSSDGYRYVGGLSFRMNPGGTNMSVICQNTRNTHDQSISSFGDVFQVDNDDPAHARASWVMEHSNFGYASLEDGGRSWEEAAKTWEEFSVDPVLLAKRGDARSSQSHWRENYPGTTPPDYVIGSGAPMGSIFLESDELGESLRGSFIICETVNKAVYQFKPKERGTHVEMGPYNKLISLNEKSKDKGFLPTEIVQALDGSLFLSDWNSTNNRRGRGGPEGAIYRISPKSEEIISPVMIDYESTQGQISALKSPNSSIRFVAAEKLRETKQNRKEIVEFVEDTANPYFKARGLWILAKKYWIKNREYVEGFLNHEDPQLRLTAFRALKNAYPKKLMHYGRRVVNDSSLALARELALSLREVSLSKSKSLLIKIIEKYNGSNRWFLEAIGTASSKKEQKVYSQIVTPLRNDKTGAKWDTADKNLAWRLRTPDALNDLRKTIIAQAPGIGEFRHLIMSFALAYSDEERKTNIAHLENLRKHPNFSGEEYQATIQEVLDKDLYDEKAAILRSTFAFPETYGVTPTKTTTSKDVAQLKGDVKNGHVKASLCLTCHKIDGAGVQFGPNLSDWGKSRSIEVIAQAILEPSSELAHGFEKAVVVANRDHKLEGIDVGYSWHAGAIKVKTVGGQVIKIAFRRSGARITRLENHSWMPSASKLGLSNQDVRDIAEYLKSL